MKGCNRKLREVGEVIHLEPQDIKNLKLNITVPLWVFDEKKTNQLLYSFHPPSIRLTPLIKLLLA